MVARGDQLARGLVGVLATVEFHGQGAAGDRLVECVEISLREGHAAEGSGITVSFLGKVRRFNRFP